MLAKLEFYTRNGGTDIEQVVTGPNDIIDESTLLSKQNLKVILSKQGRFFYDVIGTYNYHGLQ